MCSCHENVPEWSVVRSKGTATGSDKIRIRPTLGVANLMQPMRQNRPLHGRSPIDHPPTLAAWEPASRTRPQNTTTSRRGDKTAT
jgi:hypothetical protein